MAEGNKQIVIAPQPGFQELFAASKADVTIGGGVAGCGKSYGSAIDPLRYCVPGISKRVNHSKFRSILFRRTQPEIKLPGGIWEESVSIGSLFGAKAKESKSTIVYPSGAELKFNHLQYESDLESHRSGQYDALYFDELTTFTEKQFWFMLSRNRSRCGIKAYCKATTNPEPQGWVKRLIAWYIYPDDYHMAHLQGLPRWERAGLVRYYFRYKKLMYWGDDREELIDTLPEEARDEVIDDPVNKIKTFTFIPGKLENNKALISADPSYKGNLLAGDPEDVARFYHGSWQFYITAQTLFTPKMIEDALTNKFVRDSTAPTKRYMTADIAFEGVDDFVIGCWNNWHLYRLIIIPKSTGKQVEQTMRQVMRDEQIPVSRVAYDANGVGGFLSGYFRNAISVYSNGKVRKRIGEEEKDNYDQLRSQLFFILREKMRADNSEVLFDLDSDMYDRVEAELTAHEKKITPTGKLAVISKDLVKKKISGKSPDIADTLAMRSAFELEWEEEEEEDYDYGVSYVNS